MTSTRKWSSITCRPSRASGHSADDAGSDDLRQPVDVQRGQTERRLELLAHRLRPRLGAEHPDLQRELVHPDARLAQALRDVQRVGRRAAQHLPLQVAQQQRLARRDAAGDRDRQRAERLGALMEAEPAREQSVPVGVVHDHAGAHARHRHAARHHLRPDVEVVLRVGDDRRAPARAAGRVDAPQRGPRHGQQAERVVLAQVVLDRERQVGQLAGAGRDPLAERRAPDALDGGLEPRALQRLDLLARRALNRCARGHASSPRGCGSAPG